MNPTKIDGELAVLAALNTTLYVDLNPDRKYTLAHDMETNTGAACMVTVYLSVIRHAKLTVSWSPANPERLTAVGQKWPDWVQRGANLANTLGGEHNYVETRLDDYTIAVSPNISLGASPVEIEMEFWPNPSGTYYGEGLDHFKLIAGRAAVIGPGVNRLMFHCVTNDDDEYPTFSVSPSQRLKGDY